MALPEYLFASSDGALYDTRAVDWSAGRPVRAVYKMHPGTCDSLAAIKAALRAGPYAWPGGYPLYFATKDGAALSFDAVRQQFASVVSDHLDDTSSGWRVVALLVNEEDSSLTCDHSGARIPSAHGDDEEEAAPWVYGSNMPGYMPDNPASGAATWEEARDALASEIERDAESANLSGDGASEAILDAVALNLKAATPGEAWEESTGARAYFIAENPES